MQTRRVISLVGSCGMATCAILYVCMLAVWPDVPLTRSIWAFPIYARADVLAAWMVGLVAVVGAWRLGSRLAPAATIVWATVLIGAPVIWVITMSHADRASVDGWPQVGDHAWRTYVAPAYAEYAVILFLGFASLAVLTISKTRQRSSEV